jgi:hypothetical protein
MTGWIDLAKDLFLFPSKDCIKVCRLGQGFLWLPRGEESEDAVPHCVLQSGVDPLPVVYRPCFYKGFWDRVF